MEIEQQKGEFWTQFQKHEASRVGAIPENEYKEEQIPMAHEEEEEFPDYSIQMKKKIL